MATCIQKSVSLLCLCSLGFLWSLSLGHAFTGPTYRLANPESETGIVYAETHLDSDTSNVLSRKRRQGSQDNISPTPNVIEDISKFDIRQATTIANLTEKTHKYYNSTYFPNTMDLFVDLDNEVDLYTVVPHKQLSESHLTAGKVDLPFEFTFYGHPVRSAYLATGGFVYLGPHFHDFLTATQYIAPLMGNFDLSINDSSIIRYANNGSAFIVEWNNIHVSHKQNSGTFTFQTTLMTDGRIIFAYKKVPIAANTISGGNGHKVTVGLSDGFYIDEPISKGSTTIKRTIYRYHTVDLNKTQVVSNSAFMLTPLLTCNQFTNCNSCLSVAPQINFDCRWCGAIKRCSSGFDRYRQDWLEADCLTESIEPSQSCPGPSSAAGAIIAVVVVLGLWAGIAWLIYAYRNPTSNSGLFLIELRHYFKKDSTTATNNEDRYAVTISGDIQTVGMNGDAVEIAPEKPNGPPAQTDQSEA